jgi:hypothetical protein
MSGFGCKRIRDPLVGPVLALLGAAVGFQVFECFDDFGEVFVWDLSHCPEANEIYCELSTNSANPS